VRYNPYCCVFSRETANFDSHVPAQGVSRKVHSRKAAQLFLANTLLFGEHCLILRPHFSDMYAVVEMAGKQFKVEEQQSIFVHRLAAEEGDTVAFDRVLLVDNNGNTRVGMPVLEGSSVKATVLSHVKGDKVLIFKKKRRKGYAVKRGHRQQFTRIRIESIQA